MIIKVVGTNRLHPLFPKPVGACQLQCIYACLNSASPDAECYELTGGCYSIYGFEYKPGFDDAYITWISDGQAVWTMTAGGMKADKLVEIDDRPVPQEPLVRL
jgi:hypothetical protein